MSLLVAVLSFCSLAICEAEPVTTGTIVQEMIDFDRLCEMPLHSYKTLQFTSSDRRSKVSGGPGWFENSDGFGSAPIPPFEKVLKKPNDEGIGEYLMVDVQGPGAIVRTWTADINGTIRVYLDDAKEPVYDGPAERFLHHPYDTFVAGSGVTAETLEGAFYQRDAAYCPIPFAKRCRIEWVGNQKRLHFYYIQIRKYLTDEVVVETFKTEDLKTYAEQMTHVASVLADPDANSPLANEESLAIDLTLEPGSKSEPIEIQGPGAVEQLALLVEAADQQAALRQTVMHITCDNWSSSQVQSPVGDFFAAAPGVNPYVSLPFTVQDDGRMISRYLMPYKESVRVEFQNLGDQPVHITGTLSTKSRDWNDDRTMHFYARWRVTHDIATPPALDIPFLLANGTGRYVGTASLMMNTARGTHMGGTWWGEGDEKVYVDGDILPSWFGTGSEDYYNYAWSAFDIFFHPYCAQPRNDGPANRGFVANNRFHFIDDQPFQSRLSFYMELLSNHSVKDFSYACQSYHYGRPGIMDDHRTITSEDVRKPELPGPWTPLAHHASTGATYFEPEDLTAGNHSFEQDNLWSEGKLMVWKPTKMGDTIKLTVPVKELGTYEIRVGLALDHRSGTVSATLDGEPFGFGGKAGKMDLYALRRTMTRASKSDKMELSPGDHVIEIKYEQKAQEGAEPFVGVDFIWLQPH